MLKPITPNIIAFSFSRFGSKVYLLKKEKVIIDTSSAENRNELLSKLKALKISSDDIKIVLLTHGHYDHVGNVELFTKAKVYVSQAEIDSIKDRIKRQLIPLSKLRLSGIRVIATPGHTAGSVCFFMPKQKILFSGDTIFDRKASCIGRTDLPTSVPEKMQESIDKLKRLKFKILCPGH